MAAANKILSLQELQARKLQLENKLLEMEGQISVTYQQLKINLQPQQILQEVAGNFVETIGFKKRLINILVGIVLTYFSKKTVEKIFRFYLDKWTSKNPDSWLTVVLSILKN